MNYSSKAIVALFIFNFSFLITQAQVAINTDSSNPDASAMLDISSTDKGLLIPRMDSTTRNNIVTTAEGLMVFDSTTNSFWYYTEDWQEIRTTFYALPVEDGEIDQILMTEGNDSLYWAYLLDKELQNLSLDDVLLSITNGDTISLAPYTTISNDGLVLVTD